MYWRLSKGRWTPVGPLAADAADAIAGYLQKGFRLRPPGDARIKGFEDVEASDPADRTDEAETSLEVYECKRHGARKVMRFYSWKAYRTHCVQYGETLQYPIPDHVVERIVKNGFVWYCALHDMGFHTKRQATIHRNLALALYPKKGVHVTLNTMRMKGVKKVMNG